MLFKPWFVVAALLFLTHQILQKILAVPIPFADSFLDPLLFMPLLLQLMLLERRLLFRRGPDYILSWAQILGTVVLVSLLCELLFVFWSDAFTADYLDVLCYLTGGAVFGVFFNVPCSNPGVRHNASKRFC